MQQSFTTKLVHFGTFDLDLQSGELRKQGLKIRLPRQSFQILARLLDRPGEVVSREELRQTLWPGGTFVEFDVGLSSAVKKLRDALGDSAENPRFIETLPRLGYRFIAPLNGPRQAPDIDVAPLSYRGAPVVPGETAKTATRAGPRRRSLGRLVAAVFTAAVLIVALLLLNQRSRDWLLRSDGSSSLRSIAVLPLENLTGEQNQQYLADGLTDALTTDLAETLDLRVVSRTSTARYHVSDKSLPPLPVIGRELNVDGIIEGAFVRSGDHVHVTAQLIDARTDRHLWARDFDRRFDDVVALQEELAQAIAEAIAGRLTARQQAHLAKARKISADADELLFKAAFAAGPETYEGFREAIRYAEEATTKQPDFAYAYAKAAIWYNQFAFTGGISPLEFMPKAEDAARRSIELDEATPEAHAALGLVLYRYHWDWSGAEHEFRRSLELNPSFADGHRMLGVLLADTGRAPEAVTEARRAKELDPLSTQALLNLGMAHREAGQSDQAISEFRTVLQNRPGLARGHLQLGVSLLRIGELNAAITELQTAVRIRHGSLFLSHLGYAEAAIGNRTAALNILSELNGVSRLEFVSPVDVAGLQIGLGQNDAALASLEKACEVRDPQLTNLLIDYRMDAVRADSRFEAVLRHVGLIR
jgi:TolB-like protein/DNA-binding winged helix-turn-helix (wHTH) protein/Flp pilus assembly protein TadD